MDFPATSLSLFATRPHPRDVWFVELLNPHFHFETVPPNLWIIAIINIHAGCESDEDAPEVGTQWVRNKISHFISCSMLL
jgi:hypothetical protein